MRKPILTVLMIATLLLSACWTEKAKTVVVLVDATMSIDPAEYERCNVELRRLMERLGRGDRLVLVPITGEPQELLGPRIVHIHMPKERVSYDSNLKKARAYAAKQIEQFVTDLPAIQAKATDIIGAMRAVQNEFGANVELVILSDMVLETAELCFPTAPELAHPKSAEALAEQLARRDLLRGTKVKVGMLKSFGLEKMNAPRREATQAFWRRYFLASGASSVRITVDLETIGE